MTIQFDLVRPDDLLNIRVRALNLRLNAQDREHPVLEIEDEAKTAFLIFVFPPQTIHEPAYYEAPIVVIDQDPASGVPVDPDAGPDRPGSRHPTTGAYRDRARVTLPARHFADRGRRLGSPAGAIHPPRPHRAMAYPPPVASGRRRGARTYPDEYGFHARRLVPRLQSI